MSDIIPTSTTVGDICLNALREAGVVGFQQSALPGQIIEAQARLQWMLQQWARKRWLVPFNVTTVIPSTGALTYSVGPGGDFDTGAGSSRPDKIEYAMLRQLTQSQPNQIDYPLEILQSMEDYNRIALKQLNSFPSVAFYNPTFPLGELFVWPVAQASIYGVGATFKMSLPVSFANTSAVFELPYEYYAAMLFQLAIRLRSRYNIPSFPGDTLPGLAKDALAVLRGANSAIARLTTGDLNQPGLYNIFSDRFY